MVKWKDPEVQLLCGFSMALLMVFFLGLYTWYFLLTLDKVEWRLIARKTRFRVVHIPYLVGRYSQLGTLITLVVSANDRRILVDCRGAGTLKLTATLGNIALVGASTNFALRALVMWKDTWYMLSGLVVVLVIHTILALAMGITGPTPVYDQVKHQCTIMTSKSQHLLVGFYAFTLGWDLIILVFTVAALHRQRLSSASTLWSALFKQGFGYLITTCLTSIPIMVLVFLNLNDTMNVILSAPGGTINVIISSSFVIYLLDMPETVDHSANSVPSSQALPKSAQSEALTTHIDMISTVDSSRTQEQSYWAKGGGEYRDVSWQV